MTRMRDMEKANGHNDGTRGLLTSILHAEVARALAAWLRTDAAARGVMIGGVALSHYVKPRFTQDVDFLFLGAVPDAVPGFRRVRPGAFRHNATHVEIEVVTPASINMTEELSQWIVHRAVHDPGIDGRPVRIASVGGLVASKLGRFSRQDQADIENLMTHFRVDVGSAPLNATERARLRSIADTLEPPQ